MSKKRKKPVAVIPLDPPYYSELWVDFFNRVQKKPKRSFSTETIFRAMRFWRTFPPRWVVALSDPDKCLLLDLQHSIAQQFIMAEMERRDIPCAAVARSGELCRTVLYHHPEIGEWSDVTSPTWPDCVEGAKMRDDQRQFIREAEDAMVRLEAKVTAESLTARSETATPSEDDDRPGHNGQKDDGTWVRGPVLSEAQIELALHYERYGQTGKEVAEHFQQEWRKPVSQPTVSRAVTKMNEWRRANPQLNQPQIPTRKKKVVVYRDLNILDMGQRSDGRGASQLARIQQRAKESGESK